MSWHLGRMCGFDLETTGIDVEKDRIVTACTVLAGGGQPAEVQTWLADPGIEIPEGAANVHGITTERARAEGRPAADVVGEVTSVLAMAVRDGVPVVAMNAAYDLTLLDRECARHGIKSLTERVGDQLVVVDPRVIDKHYDPYRPGRRTLTDLCAYYRVPLDGAHSADADAIAACRVAWRIAATVEPVGTAVLADLHTAQTVWARQQAESLADYFRRTPGKEHQADGIRADWPLIPRQKNGA